MRYKRHHDGHARLTTILSKDDELYLDRPTQFRSAAKNFVTKEYNKLLPKKAGLYKVVGVYNNTLRILQRGMENTTFTHRGTQAFSFFLQKILKY